MGRAPDDWEIHHAVRTLESAGFIVVRPTEAELPVIVEIEGTSEPGFCGMLGVRLEVEQRGQRFCLREQIPAELACLPDEPDFRDNHLPRILCKKIAHHLADVMLPQVAEQVKEKIKPFIFKKHFSLAEIEGFIAMALDQRYSREQLFEGFPQFKDGEE